MENDKSTNKVYHGDNVIISQSTNMYTSVTKIFGNWYIVGQKENNRSKMGVVDALNNIIIPIDYGLIFANDEMIFVNREKSFVMDSNGNYIAAPQDNISYSSVDGNGTTMKYGSDIYIPNTNIITYLITGEGREKLHIFIPGQKPSADTPYYTQIKRFNDKLIQFFSGSKSYWKNPIFGIINTYGNEVLPCNYEFFSERNGVYYFIERLGMDQCKDTFNIAIDKNGHILTDPYKINHLRPNEDGFAIFSESGLFGSGLMNPSFEPIIPSDFLHLTFKSSGVLQYGEDYTVYYIDYKENPLAWEDDNYVELPMEFCHVKKEWNDRYKACRKTDEKEWRKNYWSMPCGLIDCNGQTIMPFEYEALYRINWFGKECICFKKNGKEGIADLDGNILLENKYDRINTNFKDECVSLPFTTMWNEGEDGSYLYGVLDSDFHELLPPIHQVLRFPKEDIIVFMFNNIWGFYSTIEQSTRILHGYSMVRDFSEGYSSVNIGGKLSWEDVYDDFGCCQRQLRVNNGQWGVIDKTGQLIIPCIYDIIAPFNNGGAIVRKDEKRGLVNTKGEIIVPIDYDEVENLRDGIYIVGNDGLYGFVTEDGFTVECKYSKIKTLGVDLFVMIKENAEWGLVDRRGKIVVAPFYHHIEYTSDGNYCCYLCEYLPEYDIIDMHGNIISSIRIEEEAEEDFGLYSSDLLEDDIDEIDFPDEAYLP